MGKRKVEMKRIEDKNSRQVTFSKRRTGLIKKARELSILCDVEIAVVIFSGRGRLYEFSSAESLTKILERYRRHYGEEPGASEDVNETVCSHTELLHIVQRQLEEPTVQQLSVMDLVKLEKQLEMALSVTRDRKTQLMTETISALQEKEKLLKDDNELLKREIASMEKNEDCSKEVEMGLMSDSQHLDHHHHNHLPQQQQTLMLLP